MSWSCPVCNKKFAKDNQSHICENIDPELLFSGKDEDVYMLYMMLIEKICEKLETNVTATKNAIVLYASSHRSFFVMAPKRKFLEVWFSLDYKLDDPAVAKVIQASKAKFVHFVKIKEPQQINRKLLSYIAKAYKLVC